MLSAPSLVLTAYFKIILFARREWEFCALTPEEQEKERKRAIESQRAWKKQIAEIQRRIGSI